MKQEKSMVSQNSDIQKLVKEFTKNLETGVKAIQRAAQIYARAIQNYGQKARIMFQQAFPSTTQRSWDMMESIGFGTLVPNAFMLRNDSTVDVLKQLPMELQTILAGENAVPQKVIDSTGHVTELPLSEMSYRQVNTLVDRIHKRVRTMQEQKEFLCIDGVEVETPKPKSQEKWKKIGQEVHIRRCCILTQEDVKKMAEAFGYQLSK